jgi:hypothetical protein
MTQEIEVSKESAVTAEDVKAMVEAKVQTALDEAMARPLPEVAEPYLWWNLYSLGPWQAFAPFPAGPLPPHQLIRIGEPAFVATVLVLNPFPILPPIPPGMSPCSVVTGFQPQYEINYQTCNLSTCGAGAPNATHNGVLVPNQCTVVDVLSFVGQQQGIFEMHISARITANPPAPPHPPFAGFARWVFDFDPELFWPGPTPGWQYDFPIKFMVYP